MHISPITANAASQSANAHEAVAPFDSQGVLSEESLQWLQGVALNPARAAKGPCALVSAGIFTFLNTGSCDAADSWFDEMRRNSMAGKDCNMSTADVIERLRDSGMHVEVDVFLPRRILEGDRYGYGHGSLAGRLGAQVAREHAFDRSDVAACLGRLGPGQANLLFVDTSHVIAVARDRNELFVFDTALNPHKDWLELGPRALEEARRMQPYLFTPSEGKVERGTSAQRLLESYVDCLGAQPVVVRALSASMAPTGASIGVSSGY